MLRLNTRLQEIHDKGFDMSTPKSTPVSGNTIPDTDYAKLRVGIRSLEDAVISLGEYKKLNPNMTKENI